MNAKTNKLSSYRRGQRAKSVINAEHDRRVFGSKPIRVILLCPWEERFTVLPPGWRSWQAALNLNLSFWFSCYFVAIIVRRIALLGFLRIYTVFIDNNFFAPYATLTAPEKKAAS